MFLTTLAFAILGMITGNITGLSRDPAVGVVIPAVLTLVSGLLVYLISTKGAAKQISVAAGIIAMSVNLLAGLYWGARARVIFDFNSQAYQAALTAPSTMRATQIAGEDTNYAIALKRLQHEIEFAAIKSALEQKHKITLYTVYPSKDDSKPADTPKSDKAN
jgi:hypothetical protein